MRLEHAQGRTAFCSRCCLVHADPFDIECDIFLRVIELARDMSERIDVAVLKAQEQGKRGRPRKYSSDAARQRADYARSRLNGHSPSSETWQIVTTDSKHFHENRGAFLTDAPRGYGKTLQIVEFEGKDD